MLRRTVLCLAVVTAALLAGVNTASAQAIAPAEEYDDYDRAKIDRYLDVEVWSGHSDGEYYEGDNIVIYFRANRDAFVSLYSIDTRGRVNLLFPTHPGEDNFIHGGVTYSLPGGDEDFDLQVTGPEGFENIQVIASRERFPIPDWYRGAELVTDWDNRDDYMDWVNANYFIRYDGQRFAYDRAVIYVNEWEEYYFRPIYDPYYPSWTVYGNAYFDYYWGSSIYVNGIYWGCSPLYIPRIAVGWHTISIYDQYGYGWENDFHVSRYNTVVFNKTIIKTSPSVKSKYKEVRTAGYRNPANHGYSNYEARKVAMGDALAREQAKSTGGTVTKTRTSTEASVESMPMKYTRGSTRIVKTDRGYETDASTAIFPREKRNRQGSTDRTRRNIKQADGSAGSSGPEGRKTYRSGSSRKSGRSSSRGSVGQSTKQGRSSSGGTSRIKTGSSSTKRKTGSNVGTHRKSGSSTKSAPSVGKRKSSGKTSSRPVEKTVKSSKPPKSSSSGNKSDNRVKSSSKKSGSSGQKASSSKKKSDDRSRKSGKKK